MADFEVFLVIDSNGDYSAGETYETAVDAFSENIGGHQARRVLKIVVRAALPDEVEPEIVVEVPDRAQEPAEATGGDAQ